MQRTGHSGPEGSGSAQSCLEAPRYFTRQSCRGSGGAEQDGAQREPTLGGRGLRAWGADRLGQVWEGRSSSREGLGVSLGGTATPPGSP